MQDSPQHPFGHIKQAIAFHQSRLGSPPNEEEIAVHLQLSLLDFQLLFQEWVGTTPRSFFRSLVYTKDLLPPSENTLFDSAEGAARRVSDVPIQIEAMTADEYASLTLQYWLQNTPMGTLFLASTEKGLCYVGFHGTLADGLSALHDRFPKAKFILCEENSAYPVDAYFQADISLLTPLTLHLNGTPFQLTVWRALLTLPFGQCTTYGQLAKELGQDQASRAVGTAIGRNPIAFLIPCHRVIQASGQLGGYRWGTTQKALILGWEQAKIRK